MNLGGRWGDAPEAVEENLRRLAEAGGYEPASMVRVRQVHGAEVMAVGEVGPGSEADGLWTHAGHAWSGPGAAPVLGVMTADCVPLLLVDRAGTVAAAVHSGWRGTVANIAGEAVARLVEGGGVAASQLLAAIGPCIELDAFEVGEEVAEQFEARFVARAGYAKPHVDLVACVRAQLEAAGLPPNQIERVGACTHANPGLYFSYRRDGAGIGQHLAFIGLAR
ncbi:laccase domain-containing protein [Pseudenhygromyxa sp. WMMC2535]|nr:laccase domain-containing protein [Pseudenhygromyxa sp. WMMC2535]